MRLPRTRAPALLLLPLVAASWNCETTQNGLTYSFKPLSGVYELSTKEELHPYPRNTSYEVNPCEPIKKIKDKKKDELCKEGTYVCAVRHLEKDKELMLEEVIPLAGGPDSLKENVTMLDTPEEKDGKKKRKGVRVTLHGEKYNGYEIATVIDFVCDKDRTGLEGLKKVELEATEDKEPALKFVSFIVDGKSEPKTKTLKLEWKTKQACEEFAKREEKEAKTKEHWGFFTWVFIIAFMGIAAYLVFKSWFNYSMYGARGWDLLPHSDTFRDIPYLFQDFMRRLVNTLQGRSSRGGYSAV